MKVVVVDDEKEICDILRYILERVGHDVHSFNRAQDALEAIPRLRPEVVVCDYRMPHLSGREFFTRILPVWKGTFLLLTGEPLSDFPQLLELGIKDVLFKPRDLGRIVDLLAKLSPPPV